jgi:AcrR family transcriptional regulator
MPCCSMEQKRPRPANRPSRRPEIVRAAIDLLSVQLPDAISVGDIATQAGMTPAAFYYHFPSKDDLLNEIVAGFATEWVDEMSHRLEKVETGADIPELVSAMVSWLDDHERPATVFFVTSVAATEKAEETRRQTRNDLYAVAIEAVRRAWPSGSPAETGVAGVALVILIEVASRSRLQMDESYRGLGPVRFRSAAGALARALVPAEG